MKNHRVLLIGNGGREHAIAWKLDQSTFLEKLFISPGNPGTAEIGENIMIDNKNFSEISTFITNSDISMVIVGPEIPLVDGITDFLTERHKELIIIGPDAEGATLEGSKDYAKKFMADYKIPTAKYETFNQDQVQEAIDYINEMKTPIVLKADGLAAGKGVVILETHKEAEDTIKEMLGGKFGTASHTVVIEEFLDGIEFSIFALTDGEDYVILPEAKDYKRIGEGDKGLNTGGMGSVSPVPFFTPELREKVEKEIIRPTVDGLKDRGINYKGFLFFGLILVNQEVLVIEYNVRMGDPETQSVMMRLDADFLELCNACGRQDLKNATVSHTSDHVVSTVMVSGGYPESYKKGFPITLPQLTDHTTIFQAGTAITDNQLTSSGGRVLAVTSRGSSLAEAITRSREIADSTQFANSYYRKDIGNDLL